MKVKLNELATIQMGYSFRSRIEVSKAGDVAVIQMKDLQDDNTVNCEELIQVELADVKDHHLAQEGDLVFRSRGLVSTSAILNENIGKAVIAAPLLRIRVTNPDKVLPEYLNWYISQRDAQIFLTSRAKGTVQKMISKHSVEELEVFLPSLEQQLSIVELASLLAREQILLDELSIKREQYVNTLLMKIAKGETC